MFKIPRSFLFKTDTGKTIQSQDADIGQFTT